MEETMIHCGGKPMKRTGPDRYKCPVCGCIRHPEKAAADKARVDAWLAQLHK